jgi:hypothetical protein
MLPLEILLLVVEAVEALVSPYYIEAWWRNVGININYSSNSVLSSIGAGIIFVCIFLKIVLAVVIEKTKTASLMINHV